MAAVSYTVEAAFGTNPLTTPVSWTDITSYVRGFSSRVGKEHELSANQAGELTVRLQNTDRRFDPSNTAGPYYPNVRPMTRIRVRATEGVTTYDLFQGFVEDWAQVYSPRPVNGVGDAECVVRAADAFKLFSLFDLNPYSDAVLADSPLGYWRLRETSGTTARDEMGSNNATYLGGPTFGVAGPLTGGSSAVSLAGASSGQYVDAGTPAAFQLTGDVTVEFWLYLNETPAAVRSLVFTQGYYTVRLTTARKLNIQVSSETGGTESYDSTSAISTGVWTHVAVVRSAQTISFYINGVLDSTAKQLTRCNANTAGLSFGGMSTGTTQVQAQMGHVAIFNKALTANQIATHYAQTFDTFASAAHHTHVGYILDIIGWPAGERSIDTSTSTASEWTPSGSALSALQKLEVSEGGLLWMTGDGKVRLISRSSLLTTVSGGSSIGDGGGAEVAYSDIEPRDDDQDLYSRVVVGNQDADHLAEDATSKTTYGPRALTSVSGLLLNDPNEADDRANGLLYDRKAPRRRIDSVELSIGTDSSTATIALGGKPGNRHTVLRRPPGGGSASSVECVIEGVRHDWTMGRSHRTTLSLAPAPYIPFILDDATYGLLDTGRLGY